jgi:ribosomal protein S18 acetylase RimI-like enzyme
MLSIAQSHDAERVAELQLASWRATYVQELSQAFLDAQNPGDWARLWRQQIADGVRILLSTEANALEGFVAFGPSRGMPPAAVVEWEIYNLHVRPAMHRKGIGGRLFDAAADAGRGAGARALVLWVVSTNQRARAFYEARDMRPDGGEQQHAIGDRALHEVRYRMAL